MDIFFSDKLISKCILKELIIKKMNYVTVISHMYHAKEIKGHWAIQRKLISVLWFDNVHSEQEWGLISHLRGIQILREEAEKCVLTGVVEEAKGWKPGYKIPLWSLWADVKSGRNVQITSFPSENANANLQP